MRPLPPQPRHGVGQRRAEGARGIAQLPRAAFAWEKRAPDESVYSEYAVYSGGWRSSL